MSTSVSCYSGLLLDSGISTCILEPRTGLEIVLKHSTGSECRDSSPSWGNCRALSGWPGLRCPELMRQNMALVIFLAVAGSWTHGICCRDFFKFCVHSWRKCRATLGSKPGMDFTPGRSRLNAHSGAMVADPSQCSFASGEEEAFSRHCSCSVRAQCPPHSGS